MYTVVAPVPGNLITALIPYRQQFDPQANLAPPLSLVEPFQFTVNPEPLFIHLSAISEDYAPVRVFLAGWDICQAQKYQLHLPMTAGQAELMALRRDLLSGVLSTLAVKPRTYQPGGVLFGHVVEESQLATAKQTLKSFEPFFNFRVRHMELWQREEPHQPWNLMMKFSFKGTVAGSSRQKNNQPR